jgi:Zn-dependent peptidase ImmA (M78 family)
MATVRRRQIRSLTKQLLQEHQMVTPPINVAELARRLGVLVQLKQAEEELSGFLLRDIDGHKALIGVNSEHHLNRQRFTIAHELGHLLLHEGEPIHVDRGLKINLRNEAASQGTLLEEKEANLFAAELLMPSHFIRKDLQEKTSLDLEQDIQTLADSYQVSTQAMMYRLAYLKYLEL